MTPSWYDVLDVDPDASTAEIRAAWKAGVADLDPTDRRFRLLNTAAEVLLDDERRAVHDAELAQQSERVGEPEPPAEGGVDLREPVAGRPADDAADDAADDDADVAVSTTGPVRRIPAPSPTVVVVLAVLALVLVVATVVSFVAGGAAGPATADDDGLPDAREVAAARAAAEAAIVPVLSYDYRTLEQDKQAAISYMTPGYAEEYEQLFEAVVAVNAPATETVVSVEVQTSGIVRTGEGLVDVLLFVDRPTVNRQQTTPQIFKDQATVRMRDVGGEWLVDCLIAGAGDTCES